MRPSAALEVHRAAVRAAVARSCARNPRVFGSALHGDDREDSDIDIVVDVLPGTTLFDLGGLQSQLEEILGMPVDLVTPGDISRYFRQQVLAEAKPI